MSKQGRHEVVSRAIGGVGFGFYGAREARRLSVKEITEPVLFDNLRNPVPGGLYDPSLGPLGFNETCAVCRLGYMHCPGHFGSIRLPLPVFHPLLFPLLLNLMRCVCLSCHKLRAPHHTVALFLLRLRLLSQGRVVEALGVAERQGAMARKARGAASEEGEEEEEEGEEGGGEGGVREREGTRKGGRNRTKVGGKGKRSGAGGGEVDGEGGKEVEEKEEEEEEEEGEGSEEEEEEEEEEDEAGAVDEELGGLAFAGEAALGTPGAPSASPHSSGNGTSQSESERKSKSRKRSGPEWSWAVEVEWKRCVRELWRAVPGGGMGKCASCGAANNKLRRDGPTRLLKLPLTKKQQLHNARKGVSFPDVMSGARQAGAAGLGADVTMPLADSPAPGEPPRGAQRKRKQGDVFMQEGGDAAALALARAAEPAARPLVMSPSEVRAHLRLLFHREPMLCTLLFGDKAGAGVGGSYAASLQQGQRSHNGGGRGLRQGLAKAGHAAGGGTHGRKGGGHLGNGAAPGEEGVEEGQGEGQREGGEGEGEEGNPLEMFFLRCLLVPPNKFRPASALGDLIFENPQNVFYTRILDTCKSIRDQSAIVQARTGGTLGVAAGKGVKIEGEGMEVEAAEGGEEVVQDALRRLTGAYTMLQQHVNSLMDSSISVRGRGEDIGVGIRQALERKEGLFRMNMMGKRVNYACRSVISPDPHLQVHEIGVPPYFAMRLSYPELATSWNVEYLRQLVENGPWQLPGATHIEDEKGTVVSLHGLSAVRRRALARTLLSTPSALLPPASATTLRSPSPMKPTTASSLTPGGGGGGGVLISDADGTPLPKRGGAFASLSSPSPFPAMGSPFGTPGGGGPNGKGAAEAMSPAAHPRRAAAKVVYRHLRDGDLVLVNRQPTLHRPGIMAHRVRLLKGERTLRLHYANCNVYNADFDGDEMNVHLPQDSISRAEAACLVDANLQYILPTNGLPARGLIQDHVIAATLLSLPSTFLTLADFNQLLCAACLPPRTAPSPSPPPSSSSAPPDPYALLAPGAPSGAPGAHQGASSVVVLSGAQGMGGVRVRTPPAIMKPQPLWTGKQLISALLQHLTEGEQPMTMQSACKVSSRYWGGGRGEDGDLRVRQGDVLTGCFDKAQFGRFGVVHCFQELYGSTAAGRLLSALSRLFTAFLQMHGFTCGVDDLLLTPEADVQRASVLAQADTLGPQVQAAFAGVPGAAAEPGDSHAWEAVQAQVARQLRERKESARAALDNAMISALSKVTTSATGSSLPGGQMKKFSTNCMSLMTVTGAKGSAVNFNQISVLLGQQELEGKRVPRMASGKTLPCFEPWSAEARAGGFVADRFLSGLKPQEFYFHCMAGRDGLVDTTVKTSRSGYLQRCLVKSLEGLRSHYDCSVRDNADGSVVQFRYGEDAIDATRASFLTNYKFIQENAAQEREILGVSVVEAEQGLGREMANPWYTPGASQGAGAGETPEEGKKGKKKKKDKKKEEEGGAEGGEEEEEREKERRWDELARRFADENPAAIIGVVPPSFAASGAAALRQMFAAGAPGAPGASGVLPGGVSPGGGGRGGKRALRQMREMQLLLELKFRDSVVQGGEPVGVLAAQSIGEPSTQMTLNTFHFAGRGEANVTLGIPRLREILMTAAKEVATPVMECPLRPGRSLEEAEAIACRLRRISLAEVVRSLSVVETPALAGAGGISLDPPEGGALEMGAADGREGDEEGRDGGGVGSGAAAAAASASAAAASAAASFCNTRQYLVTLSLHPLQRYPPAVGLAAEEVLGAFKDAFVPRLVQTASRSLKRIWAGAVEVGASVGLTGGRGREGEEDEEGAGEVEGTEGGRGERGGEEEEEEEVEGGEEDGADAERQRGQADDEQNYGTNEDEEDALGVSERGEGRGGQGDVEEEEEEEEEELEEEEEQEGEREEGVGDGRGKRGGGRSADGDVDCNADSDEDTGGPASGPTGSPEAEAERGAKDIGRSAKRAKGAAEGKGEVEGAPKGRPRRAVRDKKASGGGAEGAAASKKAGQGGKKKKKRGPTLVEGVFSSVTDTARGLIFEAVLSLPSGAPPLLLHELAEKAAVQTAVRATRGILRSSALQPVTEGGAPRLQVEGMNLEAMWAQGETLEVDKLSTNDISAVLNTYGVEAARAAIVQEVRRVFEMYGIGVNARHLGLVADSMTQDGTYRPCNRLGLGANPSPFLKMSFETATNFLTEAASSGKRDSLTTPSSRIILGQVADVGSGSFDLLHNVL